MTMIEQAGGTYRVREFYGDDAYYFLWNHQTGWRFVEGMDDLLAGRATLYLDGREYRIHLPEGVYFAPIQFCVNSTVKVRVFALVSDGHEEMIEELFLIEGSFGEAPPMEREHKLHPVLVLPRSPYQIEAVGALLAQALTPIG